MKKPITLITSNPGKATELSELLGQEISHHALDLPEIQSLDIAEVAHVKAEAAYGILGSPVIIDDSGFVFEAWGELPGAFAKYFLQEIGNEQLTQMLGDDRRGYAVTVLAYCDEDGVKVAVGRVDGKIADEPRGEGGFGYDPIFIPTGHQKTFGELSMDDKNKISPRAKAAQELRKILEELQ